MRNHLGPLPEASFGPEGQEPPVCAVGGQGELREVTELLCKLDTRFFFKPQVCRYVESFGIIVREASGGPDIGKNDPPETQTIKVVWS